MFAQLQTWRRPRILFDKGPTRTIIRATAAAAAVSCSSRVMWQQAQVFGRRLLFATATGRRHQIGRPLRGCRHHLGDQRRCGGIEDSQCPFHGTTSKQKISDSKNVVQIVVVVLVVVVAGWRIVIVLSGSSGNTLSLRQEELPKAQGVVRSRRGIVHGQERRHKGIRHAAFVVFVRVRAESIKKSYTSEARE